MRGESFSSEAEMYSTSPESPEAKETTGEIRDKFHAKRLDLLTTALMNRAKGLWESPVFRKAFNYAPGVGDIAMINSVIKGREGEQTLSKKERALYGVVVATSFAASYFLYEGRLEHAAAFQTASETLQNLSTLPALLKTAAERIQQNNPQMAQIFFTLSSSSLLMQALENFKKNNLSSELVSLKLSEY